MLVRERLVFGDRFRIGGYMFEFLGDAIAHIDPEVTGSDQRPARQLSSPAAIPFWRIFRSTSRPENSSASSEDRARGSPRLFNALCGIRPPTSGEVCIGGVPLEDRERLREIGIGYVPQDDIVHKELTVTEAITFSARLRLKLPRPEIDALVERVIVRLGLAEHVAKRIADLSGGQRKRVSIAIELLANPSVLFLDEPSSGLDPATEEGLMTLLQSLTLTKLTVVCTTHVLQKAYLFDRLLFVQGGRLVFAGDSDEARRHFLFSESEQAGDETERAAMELSPLERVYTCLANSEKPAAEWEDGVQRITLRDPRLPDDRPQRGHGERTGRAGPAEVSAVHGLLAALCAAVAHHPLGFSQHRVSFCAADPHRHPGRLGRG